MSVPLKGREKNPEGNQRGGERIEVREGDPLAKLMKAIGRLKDAKGRLRQAGVAEAAAFEGKLAAVVAKLRNDCEGHGIDVGAWVNDGGTRATRWYLAVAKAERRLRDELGRKHEENKAKRRAMAKGTYAAKGGQDAAFRALRAPRPRGINLLKVGQQYTANPRKIDQHVREKWGQIFDVSRAEMEEKAEAYMRKHAGCIYRAKEWKLGNITTGEVWAAILAAPATAAGPDGWFPADLRVASPQAVRWLTNMLNLIEGGHPGRGAPWKDGRWP